MSTVKVTQIKSGIGQNPRNRGTLRALGLGRIGKSNELEETPAARRHAQESRSSRECRGCVMAEELNLHTLKPAQERKNRKRVGRGLGSGKGRYSGRGIKGQKSRAGSKKMPAGFEGGQMPLDMRAPKLRGNTSADAMPIGPFRTYSQPINLRDLDRVFADGDTVNIEAMVEKGLLKNTKADVKVLGTGDLTKKLAVTAHAFSASAREKITAAGGSATALKEPKDPRKKKTKARKPAAEEPEAEAPRRQRPRPTSRWPKPRLPPRRSELVVQLARQRLARPGASPPGSLHGHDSRALPPRLMGAGAGSRLGDDQQLLRGPRRHDPRAAQPLLGRSALAVLDLRARDHAVHHGLDHPAADDGRHPAARRAAEGRRVGLRQDQPVHALSDGCARRGASRRDTHSSSAARVSSTRTSAG